MHLMCLTYQTELNVQAKQYTTWVVDFRNDLEAASL